MKPFGYDVRYAVVRGGDVAEEGKIPMLVQPCCHHEYGSNVGSFLCCRQDPSGQGSIGRDVEHLEYGEDDDGDNGIQDSLGERRK